MNPDDILVEIEKLSSKDEISKEDIMNMLKDTQPPFQFMI